MFAKSKPKTEKMYNVGRENSRNFRNKLWNFERIELMCLKHAIKTKISLTSIDIHKTNLISVIKLELT